MGRTLRACRGLYPLQTVSFRVVSLKITTNMPETAVDHIEPPNVVCSSQQVWSSESASKLPKSSKHCLPTQDRQYIPAWSAAEKPNPLCWLKESWVMESPNRKNCSYIAACRCQMYSMQFDALPATHHVDWLPDSWMSGRRRRYHKIGCESLIQVLDGLASMFERRV